LLVVILAALLGACADYGDKVTRLKGEVFYTEGIATPEAVSFADWLVAAGYFDNTTRKSVQLERVGDTCHLRFVIKSEYREEPDVQRFLLLAAYYVSTRLNDHRPTVAHISNDRFASMRVVPLNRIRGSGELVYSRVSSADARALMGILDSAGVFSDSTGLTMFVDRDGKGYRLKMVSNPGSGNDDTLRRATGDLCRQLSVRVFRRLPVDFYFVDEFLKPVAPPVYFEES
jgi:hypothetical protein